MQWTLVLIFAVSETCHGDYFTLRNNIIQEEKSLALGGDLVLTTKELEANKILLAVKNKELQSAYEDEKRFPPAWNFLRSRPEVEKSQVFAIIQRLPKGASLHTHLTSSVSLDYILRNIINRDNLYICTVKDRVKLKFLSSDKADGACKWELVKDLRKRQPTIENRIKSAISFSGDGNFPLRDIHETWKIFLDFFTTIYGFITYKPVIQDYLYQALLELHSDKVTYGEFRINFPNLYELNGTTYGLDKFLDVFAETVRKFKKDHPDFVGARIIYSLWRGSNSSDVQEAFNNYRSLLPTYKDSLAGLDFVGFEDTGKPLVEFYREVEAMNNFTDFYFHAGETNWYGFEVDQNVIDAVLLGSKRIGHGYALTKHPKILQLIKQRDIAIELSPISNQVLMFVEDLRNHPAVSLIAQGYPVVVCNDDPGIWGAKGLSYDWYMVFMGMSSKDAGLELLKKLAMNSIKYSSMSNSEKQSTLAGWTTLWNQFVDDLIKNKKNYI